MVIFVWFQFKPTKQKTNQHGFLAFDRTTMSYVLLLMNCFQETIEHMQMTEKKEVTGVTKDGGLTEKHKTDILGARLLLSRITCLIASMVCSDSEFL